jgi:Family of unknown function (DUF6086)
VFGDAKRMPTSRAVSGADKSDVASYLPRVGAGRHRADGSVGHLMAWDWSEPGRATEDRSCVVVNPGRAASRTVTMSCRTARCRRQKRAALIKARWCAPARSRVDNAAMSQYFQVGTSVLWNPSTGVARLFARQVEAVAPAVDLPTGLGSEAADEYEIDLARFGTFIDALVRRYGTSTHPVLRALIENITAVGIVLVERAGGTVPALTDPPGTVDMRDISMSTAGIGPVGEPARLRALADHLAQAMPH